MDTDSHLKEAFQDKATLLTLATETGSGATQSLFFRAAHQRASVAIAATVQHQSFAHIKRSAWAVAMAYALLLARWPWVANQRFWWQLYARYSRLFRLLLCIISRSCVL